MNSELPIICKNCQKPIDNHEVDEYEECLQNCAAEIEDLTRMVQTLKAR